jgi:hypothetical protein
MDLYWIEMPPAAKWYIPPQDPKRGIFNFVPSLMQLGVKAGAVRQARLEIEAVVFVDPRPAAFSIFTARAWSGLSCELI